MGSKKLKCKLCHESLVALIFLLYILFLEINLCWNSFKHKLLCSLLAMIYEGSSDIFMIITEPSVSY